MKSNYDTLIIGAGMSGLAAGIRLAHFGSDVCILERHSVIGGLNSFYRQGGRMFDVGLHAVTNFAPKGTKRGPLAKLLRQLRFAWEEFGLQPQVGSRIAFPGVELRFSNDFEELRSEIAREFPSQVDNFERLVASLLDYDALGLEVSEVSAREVVNAQITDPLLVEMIFCPLLYYGGAKEHDMDFAQFSIMFRAIFLEGLARPLDGVRIILQKLIKKFRKLGGEIRLRTRVKRISIDNGIARGVELTDGSFLESQKVLSSAGLPETMRLCDAPVNPEDDAGYSGQLSFIESISVLDKQPKSLGHNDTIVFYNDAERFDYSKPDELVDLRSGVICSPNNFVYGEATDGEPLDAKHPLAEGVMRITSLANFDGWASLTSEQYDAKKQQWYDAAVASAVRFVPDFRENVIATDMFTPTTIERFTGREKGAIYGSQKKKIDGTTDFENLYLCGTDQGFVGIVGTLVSGISVVNRYLLNR